jgi:acetyl esterase/lipase
VVPTVATHAYGPGPSQHGALHLPDGAGPHAVVVLLHGGFWWHRYDRTLMVPLALDLVARGHAVWNLEFRRVGEPGGGWPGTFEDVGAGLDHLDVIGPPLGVATDRVVALGHSAGGHLALWAAARPGLPAGSPGARTAIEVLAAIALAPVADLRRADQLDLGPGAVRGLLGGHPDTVPERYAVASPVERLPMGVPQVVIHGDRDRLVPIELSRDYVAAARAAGDPAELVELAGTGHFEALDPATACWRAAVERLPRLLTGRR